MKKGFLFFFIGVFFTGGLFQFNIDLPSYHAKQSLKQKAKISKTKATVRKQRAGLSKNAVKKAGKKVAGSIIPLVAPIVALGLAAQDYCEDLEKNIELQNILDDNDEMLNMSQCIKEVKNDLKKGLYE